MLHWTLYLSCGTAVRPIRTESRDISRDGFYCLIDQPVRPGERIHCDIVLPTHSLQESDGVVFLRCSAVAVRVEKLVDEAEFGLACRIEDYHIVPDSRESLASNNPHQSA